MSRRPFADRVIAEALQQPVWTVRPDGAVDYVNPYWSVYTGLPLEATLGDGWRVAVHPDDLASFETSFRAASAVGEAFEVEHRFRRADGAYRWHVARVAPIHDAHGAVISWAGMAIDIDGRWRAGHDAARLAAIVEGSQEAIVGRDLDGTVTDWNPGAERVYGYQAHEILGRDISLLIPPDLLDDLNLIRGRLDRGEPIPAFETERLRKDGTRVQVAITMSPVRDRSGRVIGASTIARDLSDRAAVRAERRDRERQSNLVAAVGTALTARLPLSDQLRRCAEALVTHLGVVFARIWTLDVEDPAVLVLRASAGLYTHLDGEHGRISVGAWKIGRIAAHRRPHRTNHVLGDPEISDQGWAEREGMVAFAGYPLLIGDRLLGVMGVFARQPLSETMFGVLASVADAITVGVDRAETEAAREVVLDRERAARERAEAAAATLATVNRVGQLLTAKLDLGQLVRAVTDAATELTGAQFGAFFYNVVDDTGETYTLNALAGDPVDVFANFPMPRPTAVFGPTFRGEGVVRLADIRSDPRYGRNVPHSGVPAGHPPVVSYLAVPVVSRSGEVLGGLFFGHSEPDVFDMRAEDLAVGLASHAAVAIDNARLFRVAQATERRYRSLFEGVADAILVTDGERRYRDANAAAEVLLGYGREELLGLRVEDVVAVEPDWTEAEFERFRTEGRWHGEMELRRKDGSTVPVEARATVVDLPEGPVYLSTIRDISDRKRTERLRRDFLAMVGHDLRSPLTTLRGRVQLLKRRAAYDATAVDAILAQTKRMGRLIDDLADLIRFEAGPPELRRASVDLVSLVRAEAEAANPPGGDHRIRVVAPEEPVLGEWDADRLGQVLQNLLGNAVKYAPGDDRVTILVEADAAEARVEVADHGPGIPPEHLARLFERFYRADATGAGGLGLGLYISRMLVEAHGGRIWARSEPGQGSTFTFVLPRG
ncbi:MAG: PAS domain S-box protein [Thermomicrobiales bacterium]